MFKKRSELLFIFSSFVFWRIGILLLAVLAIKFIPLSSSNFLGGGFSTYRINPLFWGHMNFDGEHFLAIAQNGYQPLTYFFFPVFPFIVRAISTSHDILTLAFSGVVFSNLTFLLALVGIYELVKIDFKDKIAKFTIILFLLFPTSFYFGAFYSESLFLAVVVWSFFFARKRNFIIAAILASIASATRVIGITMFPVLLIEYIMQNRDNLKVNRQLISIFISPLGLIYYLYFLWKQTGDPFNFLNTVSIFGQQRSNSIIILPQVFYRYLFKILPVINYSNFANVFTTYMEFGVAIIFLVLIILLLFKLRISYWFFALLAYLIPSLAGSFSSMPRYALVIFPVFILVGIYINEMRPVGRYIIFSVMLILFAISVAMFWRGYWIS